MSQIEIEVKSLLGEEENAKSFREKILAHDPEAELVDQNAQLNHYFVSGDYTKLEEAILPHIDNSHHEKLKKIIEEGNDHSVRTREKDGTVLFVIKASIDDTTSSNGIMRMEFEEGVNDLSLEELDKLLLDCGFEYQAKWSRKREEYKMGDVSVSLDKNAGYGYLAEFEKVVGEDDDFDEAKKMIDELMRELNITELPQDRLARMFDFYNENWRDYYGTDKVFTVE